MLRQLVTDMVHLKLVLMDQHMRLMGIVPMVTILILVLAGDHLRMETNLMDIHIMEVPLQTGLMDIMVGMAVAIVIAGAIKILSVC